MTRINTNVSSLIAQKTLSRTNADLQVSLTRLSTGLRINTGKDDPAGLIASENLRRDITSIEKAITNSERANQLIATADSALGQVSSLLNDIRGLVTEAANTGALSDEQIAANQLQVDSSLEAIDRIAQVTTFQGRKILDGSLAFLTTAGTGFGTVTSLQIDQASLGNSGQLSVDVAIANAATQAEITNDSIGVVPGDAAEGTLTFTDITTPETLASREFTFTSSATLEIAVKSGHADTDLAGAGGNAVEVTIVSGDTGGAFATATYNDVTKALVITVDNQDRTGGGGSDNTTSVTIANVIAALADDTNFTDNFETVGAGSGSFTHASDGGNVDEENLQDGVNEVSVDDVITITALSSGTAFNGTISVVTDGDAQAGSITVGFAAGALTITLDNSSTYNLSDIVAAINAQVGDDFEAALTTNDADGEFVAGTDDAPSGTLQGGTDDGESGLADNLVLEISGRTGSEVFSFEAGTTLSQIVNAINLVGDATGVRAENDNGELRLFSTGYGSSAFVDVNVISEGENGEFAAGLSGSRTQGSNIEATVNGVKANGDGNRLSISTATLNLALTVEEGSDTDIAFTITGGGALFQLGPDVVSNQQARLGIQSVNTARLGGASGKLFELRSGGPASLAAEPSKAAEIVDDVINQVTSLRGRLGAFQKTTLETNIFALNDTLASLTEAESSIRDADFAAESARLTRAQILVQSGTSVLAIANSNPQNVLALLR